MSAQHIQDNISTMVLLVISTLLQAPSILSLCIVFLYFCIFFYFFNRTVCPGSSDPLEQISNIFASENEVYTIDQLLRYYRLNIIRLQRKIILGRMNSIG